MEFCSICTDSFEPEDRRIRCNGQYCNLAFHTRCARLTEDLLRTGLDADVGLFWFCVTCRMDLVPATSREGGKHKLKEDEDNGEISTAKRIRMDTSPRLPPEVWTMIFRNLDSRWLARVRLVCRDWNEMVGCRWELMDRFLLNLGTKHVVDDLKEVRHFLALGRGYTRAEFNFYNIGKDKPRIVWFEGLGETLTTLTCSSVPFGFLYQLLRVLPNLKRLTLDNCFDYGKSAKLNYQLTKLEDLTIMCLYNKNNGHGESIFPTLQHICPRITVLKLSIGDYEKFFRDISRFLFAVRNTLQDLDIADAFNASQVMDALVKMDGLKLKRININCSEQDLVRVVRGQPTVERLHFQGQITNVTTLDHIASNLPNLKQVKLDKIKLEKTSSSKLLNFSRAEYIQVHYYGSCDIVSGLAYCQSSSLQQLEVFEAYLPRDGLISLPRIATQLKSVSFSHCTVQSSLDIVSFVQQSKSLTTFELRQLRVKTVNEVLYVAGERSCLRNLKFVDKSKELLHALIELCSELETIFVEHDLVEDDLSKMGQQLQRLKSLTLSNGSVFEGIIPVECLRPIPSRFNELKKLQIKAWGAHKETILEALQGLRKDIDVLISHWLH